MKFNTVVEACKSSFTPIEFNDVVSVQNPTSNKLLPGYYEWHKAASSTEDQTYYELRYYETEPDANSRKIVKAGGVTPNVGGEVDEYVDMGPKKKVLFVTDNKGHITAPVLKLQGELYCDGSLTIGTAKSEVTKSCPAVWLGGYEPVKIDEQNKIESGLLQATGNIAVSGTIKGTGSVVTQKDVSFCGESIIDCGDSGVAVYASNVNITPLTVALEKAPNGQALTDEMVSRNFVPDGSGIDEIFNRYGHINYNEATGTISSFSVDARRQELNDFFAKEYNTRVDAFFEYDGSGRTYDSVTRTMFLDKDGKPLYGTKNGIKVVLEYYDFTRRHGATEIEHRVLWTCW